MSVVKRDGRRELVNFDKITTRLERLCWPLGARPSKKFDGVPLGVDVTRIAATVCSSVVDGISTERLDELTADAAAGMTTEHPDYGVLAARIVVSNLQKQTSDSIAKTYGSMSSVLSADFMDKVRKHRNDYQAIVDYDLDYDFDYFGFKTMEKLYLTKVDGKIVERPQHMFLRVAIALWGDDLDKVRETYAALATKKFTHASPTLFNAGMKNQQLASCHAAGTKVSTVNRGPVNIEDVVVGDLVVTHTGSTKPVVQLHVNPLGTRTLYDLKAYKTPVVSVTGNHRFWAIKSMKHRGKRVVMQGQSPGWVSVDDLDVGDYIAIPSRKDGIAPGRTTIDVFPIIAQELGETYSVTADEDIVTVVKNILRPDWLNDRNTVITATKKLSSIKRRWRIDENFTWFLGVWYGDGCVTGRKGNPERVTVVSNPNNVELIDRVMNIGRDTFGIEPCVQIAKEQALATISFHSKALAVAFASLFGRGHLGKKLPDLAYNWDASLVQPLLGGLVSSDGCVTASGTVTVSVTNRPLLEGVYHMARQVGIDVSFRETKKPSDWNYHPVWSMTIPRLESVTRHIVKAYDDDRMNIPTSSTKTRNGIAVVDGIAYARVESKTASEKRDKVVYTLGVQDDHSYPVEGLVCENCFLLGIEDDSIAGIFDALAKCAHISKHGGGIGIHVSTVRGKGSRIEGTNGVSDGIVPLAKVYDATAAYVNQGGRRKGAIAVYLEPHHPDVFDFLDLKRNQGDESLRARNLFYAMWIPDLFMRRVEADGDWCLMDPKACPGLNDVHGAEFDALYEKYESEQKYVKKIKAQSLWFAIVRSQIETGGPYVLYKDHANAKSNQQNLGTIKCSNLCCEVVEYTSKDEIAVCTLGSLSLPAFVKDGAYDFVGLLAATKTLAKNLDRIVDANYYVVEEARTSNTRHRPIGIGVQGLANVFFELGMPFDSPEAAALNKDIFETIYYGAIEASVELAELHGPYQTFEGSPASRGQLQFDLWGVTPGKWDWAPLKARVVATGLRNSLSVAPMPTASTAQILSNVEAMEPQTSNLYSRRTLAGEFPVVNTHLVRELIRRGTWNVDMKNKIIQHGGSIQRVIGIHPSVKAVYKTAWELSMRTLIDMAADRGAYVCQSQSLNMFVAEPNVKSLSSMHFYAWKRGLKTGCYYLRTKPASSAIKITTACLSCSG